MVALLRSFPVFSQMSAAEMTTLAAVATPQTLTARIDGVARRELLDHFVVGIREGVVRLQPQSRSSSSGGRQPRLTGYRGPGALLYATEALVRRPVTETFLPVTKTVHVVLLPTAHFRACVEAKPSSYQPVLSQYYKLTARDARYRRMTSGRKGLRHCSSTLSRVLAAYYLELVDALHSPADADVRDDYEHCRSSPLQGAAKFHCPSERIASDLSYTRQALAEAHKVLGRAGVTRSAIKADGTPTKKGDGVVTIHSVRSLVDIIHPPVAGLDAPECGN